MIHFKDLRVGEKLTLGFGLILVLMAAVSLLAVGGMDDMRADADLVADNVERLLAFKRASAAQGQWLLVVTEAVFEEDPVAVEDRENPKSSPFGRWYYGPGRTDLERAVPSVESLLREIGPVHREIHASVAAIHEALVHGGDARGVYEAITLPARGRFLQLIRQVDEAVHDRVAALRLMAGADADSSSLAIKVLLPVAVVLGLIMALVIGRSIALPLNELVAAADRIAAGDLSIKPSRASRRSEIGALSRAFTKMTASLRGLSSVMRRVSRGDLRMKVKPQSEADVMGNAIAGMVQGLREMNAQVQQTAHVLAESLGRISAATSQLATSATQAAASVNETTATVEEVKQTALTSSEKAQHVAESAERTAKISSTGRRSIEDMRAAVAQIRDKVDVIAQKIIRLSEKSQMIGSIISAVNDLADQSNLLAVNASIEASKAGEEGRGFAVVAEEIRMLSEQSKRSTERIRDILDDIQKATASAVMITEQGIKAVAEGEGQTVTAGESIIALAGSVSDAAGAARQIAAASKEQLVGMEQVAQAVEQLRGAGEQNVDSASQLEMAVRDLSGVGAELQRLLKRYKV